MTEVWTVCPVYPPTWIPAFAGMTEVSTVCPVHPPTWIPAFAGMTAVCGGDDGGCRGDDGNMCWPTPRPLVQEERT